VLVLRAATLDDAINLINANPYGNGTSIFTNRGQAARNFQREVTVWGARTPHRRETWVLGVVRRVGDDQLWRSVCSIWSSFDWPAVSSSWAAQPLYARRG
jgi:hypothetical protein